ncbi:MAG: response regulator [Acidobacteriia bacterium]|nr:response regulator [Terriglobia bacterium]
MAGRFVLFVSPNDEDQWALIHILRPEGWAVDTARTCAEAMRSLEVEMAPVVIVESALPDGTWKTLQNYLARKEFPPKLIVTSRLADERLWAEVLNLGGFDVLVQPFNTGEALRCIGSACRHWHEEWSKAHAEDEAAGAMNA